jgi:hypothetical protein
MYQNKEFVHKVGKKDYQSCSVELIFGRFLHKSLFLVEIQIQCVLQEFGLVFGAYGGAVG